MFDVHRAMHPNIVSILKPTRCTNVSNLFYFGMTLYVFWTVLPSETCGVSFQNTFDTLVHLVGFTIESNMLLIFYQEKYLLKGGLIR